MMNQPPKSLTTSPAPAHSRRHLYAIPRRRVPRARWAPIGRCLHLVDIENLMGDPFLGPEALRRALDTYLQAAGFRTGDLVVIGCNSHLMIDAKLARPDARVVIGHGPGGADKALLQELSRGEDVAARFDRVCIGSGDHIFAEPVRAIRNLGIAAGVASRRDSLSYQLWAVASYVRYVSPPVATEAA